MWVDLTVPGMGLEVAEAEIGGQPAAVVEGIPVVLPGGQASSWWTASTHRVDASSPEASPN